MSTIAPRMNTIAPRVLAAGLAMLLAAGLAVATKPTRKVADEAPRIDLEVLIPRQFQDWQVDPSIVPIQVSPDVQAKLDKVYAQTLARTYVNAGGQRVMLSIAYGGDQGGESTQVHRPEFCYTAQGFQIVQSAVGDVATRFGSLTVRRLMATLDRRKEPITYWITVGDYATLPGVGRKLRQLAYGLTGRVPDGMLVRVSTLDDNAAAAYVVQDRFVNDLLSAVTPAERMRLIGVVDG